MLSSESTRETDFFMAPPNDSARLNADHDDSPVCLCIIDKLLGRGGAPVGYSTRILDDVELHLVSAREPSSFVEVERNATW